MGSLRHRGGKKSGLRPLLAFALSAPATAGEAQTLASEEDFFGEIPVVVSATRLSQPLNATPAAVTVIDREMIEASGAVELVDILRLVPGFQVAHTHGNLFTVSAHGTGAPWFSRVQVLVDGHSIYNTAFSGLDWANFGISLVDVERVEVVRGPNISTYGANAIQGTVNIITYQPFQVQGTLVQTTLGDPKRRDGVLRHAGILGGLDYRLTLEHRENQGFDGRVDSTDLNGLSFRGVYNPTSEDELDIHLGYTRSEMGVQLHFMFPPEERDVTTDYQFLRWTHSEGSEDSWYIQFSRDHYDTDENTRIRVSDWLGLTPGTVPQVLGGQPDQGISFNNFTAFSDRYDLEFQHFWSPASDLRLAWGAGYRWDELKHFLIDRPQGVSDDTGRLFGNLEWRLSDALLLNFGAMLEHSSMVGSTVSPRLGLNYALTEDHTLRASVSRAHKNPSLLEEHWRTLLRLDDGTPVYLYTSSLGDLEPERRDVAEIAYLGRWLEGQLQFDARLYHEEVNGAVIYALDGYPDLACPEQPLGLGWCYRVGNFMDYRVSGLETQLMFRTSPKDFIRLHYAYADVDGTVPDNLRPASEHNLARTAPRHSGGVLVSHLFPQQWEASLAWYLADETDWYLDGGLVDGYSRLDLRLAKGFRAGRADGKLELILQNLGSDYEEFTPLNRFETRVLLRGGLQFR